MSRPRFGKACFRGARDAAIDKFRHWSDRYKARIPEPKWDTGDYGGDEFNCPEGSGPHASERDLPRRKAPTFDGLIRRLVAETFGAPQGWGYTGPCRRKRRSFFQLIRKRGNWRDSPGHRCRKSTRYTLVKISLPDVNILLALVAAGHSHHPKPRWSGLKPRRMIRSRYAA